MILGTVPDVCQTLIQHWAGLLYHLMATFKVHVRAILPDIYKEMVTAAASFRQAPLGTASAPGISK